MQRTDTIIVGAGPIGIELAVALKDAGTDYVHLDAGPIAHTISWYPRGARFFSSPERIAIAGVPLNTANEQKATREEYLAYLRSVVEHFDLKIQTYERVIDIAKDADGFILTTRKATQERRYHCRHLVLAVGDMHNARQLQIPGENQEHVSHYFEEPHKYFQQKLLIVGGKNSAVEAALRCYRAGADVAISYRGTTFDPSSIKYWLLPEINALIERGMIAFHPETVPLGITPSHVTLGPANAAEADNTTTQDVPADFVLLLTGYTMDTTLFQLAGVELTGVNCAPTHSAETMETNVPGLYVAGTAAAGTQHHFRLFIENCHAHVTKITRTITGKPPAAGLVNTSAQDFALPES